MRYLTITSLLLVLIFAGCSKAKLSEIAPSYDQTNHIFRAIINSDGKYSVSIITSAPDTIRTEISAGVEFNYGIPVKVGDTINVKVLSITAKSLNGTILYNGVVMAQVVDKQLQGGGLEADYRYVTTQ